MKQPSDPSAARLSTVLLGGVLKTRHLSKHAQRPESKRRRKGPRCSPRHSLAGAFRAGAQNASHGLVARPGHCGEVGEVLLLGTPPVFRVLRGPCVFRSLPSAPAARPAPVGLKPVKCHCPASGEGLPGGQLPGFPGTGRNGHPHCRFLRTRSVDSFPDV